MGYRKSVLYPRKQLDIGLSDLISCMWRCLVPGNPDALEKQLCDLFAPGQPVLVTYGVRAAFDLFLNAQAWPVGSEIILSALTIREMADIVRKHGLVPVPQDRAYRKREREQVAGQARGRRRCKGGSSRVGRVAES